eukprot:TRINITY_DN1094_c0_g1_i1.p1 TRINITY_DN1094_c0_g1~~TRINITY_DN1094_c0_g1_i1.p1  ORF type:complete len:281 (+),score=75.22 TRINITY_DN1094_c0_g1_i1:103-945(+)
MSEVMQRSNTPSQVAHDPYHGQEYVQQEGYGYPYQYQQQQQQQHYGYQGQNNNVPNPPHPLCHNPYGARGAPQQQEELATAMDTEYNAADEEANSSFYRDVWECTCGVITHASFSCCSGCRLPRPMNQFVEETNSLAASANVAPFTPGMNSNVSQSFKSDCGDPHGSHATASVADSSVAEPLSAATSPSFALDLRPATSMGSAADPVSSHNPYSFAPHAYSVDVQPLVPPSPTARSKQALLLKQRRARELAVCLSDDDVELDVENESEEPLSPSYLAVYC